jgi:shikimate dehydrogenase
MKFDHMTMDVSHTPRPALLPVWCSIRCSNSLSSSIVNATSAGMKGTPSLDLDLQALPNTAAVCDIVYSPLETDLLKRARSRGLRTIDGLGMLMHQAVPSFAAFFGVTPKVTPALRSELEKALADG